MLVLAVRRRPGDERRLDAAIAGGTRPVFWWCYKDPRVSARCGKRPSTNALWMRKRSIRLEGRMGLYSRPKNEMRC